MPTRISIGQRSISSIKNDEFVISISEKGNTMKQKKLFKNFSVYQRVMNESKKLQNRMTQRHFSSQTCSQKNKIPLLQKPISEL